jgi:hypothetical protein
MRTTEFVWESSELTELGRLYDRGNWVSARDAAPVERCREYIETGCPNCRCRCPDSTGIGPRRRTVCGLCLAEAGARRRCCGEWGHAGDRTRLWIGVLALRSAANVRMAAELRTVSRITHRRMSASHPLGGASGFHSATRMLIGMVSTSVRTTNGCESPTRRPETPPVPRAEGGRRTLRRDRDTAGWRDRHGTVAARCRTIRGPSRGQTTLATVGTGALR